MKREEEDDEEEKREVRRKIFVRVAGNNKLNALQKKVPVLVIQLILTRFH